MRRDGGIACWFGGGSFVSRCVFISDQFNVIHVFLMGIFVCAGVFGLFPPKRFNINVSSVATIYPLYAEIQFDSKMSETIVIHYHEISAIKRRNRRGRRSWKIGDVVIHEPVGLLEKSEYARDEINDFVRAVERRMAEVS